MGCQTSKVSDQDEPHSLKQTTPEQASPEVAPTLSLERGLNDTKLVSGDVSLVSPKSQHSVHVIETKAIERDTQLVSGDVSPASPKSQHSVHVIETKAIERDSLFVTIADPDHPFAISLRFFSKSSPIEIKQATNSNQTHFVECEGIGHDMSLIRYICDRWQTHLLHLGVCKAIVDESVCTIQFRILPSIEAIHRKWSSLSHGHLERASMAREAMKTIISYVDHVNDLLQHSTFICNNALSLADIFAAACLMPIISLRAALNRLPLDILLPWMQRIGIYQSLPAAYCRIMIVSDADQTKKAGHFDLPSMMADTFAMMSNLRIEKYPCLIKCQVSNCYTDYHLSEFLNEHLRLGIQGDDISSIINDWILIQTDLERNSCRHLENAESPMTLDINSVKLVLYLCPYCSTLNCISPDQVALLFFIPNCNIRLEAGSRRQQNFVYFRDRDVDFTEAPAILRYLTRSQREAFSSKLTIAQIDENVTWISQKLLPLVQDFIHNMNEDQRLLELFIEHAGANLLQIESDILTADCAYLAAVAFCMQRCAHFIDFQSHVQNLIKSWLKPIQQKPTTNILSLLHWKRPS